MKEIKVNISGGVPPIMKIDPSESISAGLMVEDRLGAYGVIERVQIERGHYHVGVEWADNGKAPPRGSTAGGGSMILKSFLVVGPRPFPYEIEDGCRGTLKQTNRYGVRASNKAHSAEYRNADDNVRIWRDEHGEVYED